ncbi:MAG: hypothetical protein ACRBBN_15760 [Methyloligellaceae bacterium]
MRILFMGIFCLVMTCAIHAEPPPTTGSFCNHIRYHSWYLTLLDIRNQSCCNSEDCRCARVKYVGGRYAVQIEPDGIWHMTDHDTKIYYDKVTPNGGPHACVAYNGFMRIYIVRCLVLPASV